MGRPLGSKNVLVRVARSKNITICMPIREYEELVLEAQNRRTSLSAHCCELLLLGKKVRLES